MTDMQLLTVCDGLLLLSRRGEDEARDHACFPLFSLVAHGRYGIWTSYLLHLLHLGVDIGHDSSN